MEKLLELDRELAAVDELLERGGVVLVEGRAGIGKTALLEAASRRAAGLGHEVVRARGSELEAGFAFGVVRQLFERRLASAEESERDVLLAGSAGAVRSLLLGEVVEPSAFDTSFAVLHGRYWLTVNLSDRQPLLIAVDDAHWADEPSLRWLAHLAPRLEGVAVALLVALRPVEAALGEAWFEALRAEARAVVRPELLSEDAVGAIVRTVLGTGATDELCAAVGARRAHVLVTARLMSGSTRRRRVRHSTCSGTSSFSSRPTQACGEPPLTEPSILASRFTCDDCPPPTPARSTASRAPGPRSSVPTGTSPLTGPRGPTTSSRRSNPSFPPSSGGTTDPAVNVPEADCEPRRARRRARPLDTARAGS